MGSLRATDLRIDTTRAGTQTCIKRAVFCVCYHEAKTGAEFCFLAVDLIWKDFCNLRGICRSNTLCSFCCTCSIFRVAICLCVRLFAYGFVLLHFNRLFGWLTAPSFCKKGRLSLFFTARSNLFSISISLLSYPGRLSDHILTSYHCKS